MASDKPLCELCQKQALLIPSTKRCDDCTARLLVIKADVRKYLGLNWRFGDGLQYAMWAVLDLPTDGTFMWQEVYDAIDMFAEEPAQMFIITICGKRQVILFFYDTFK